MKKLIVLLMLAGSVFASEKSPCNIYTSPATNFSKVSGTDFLSMAQSRVYYDDNKKLQIRGFSDAAQDFNKQVLNYIKKDCKKYKFKNIYSLSVTHSVDKDYYYFTAQYDFAH